MFFNLYLTKLLGIGFSFKNKKALIHNLKDQTHDQQL